MPTRRLSPPTRLALASLLLAVTAACAAAPPHSGDALANDGNYPAAAAAFARAQKAAPANAALMAKLAEVDALRGQNQAAVTWARHAVAAAPHDAKYEVLLGDTLSNYVNDVSVFRKLGIAHQIRAAYQQAVELAPHSADARGRLAMFYNIAPGIAGGSAAEAAAQIKALATDHPARADLARAQQAAGNKQYAAAEAWYRKTAAAATDDNGYLALGEFLVWRKQPAAALTAFRSAIAAFPHAPGAYYQVGKLASEGKAPASEGARDLTRYLALAIDWQNNDPPYARAHYRLGQIDAHAGDAAKAKAEYQAALQLAPDFPAAQRALAKLPAS